MFGDSYILVLKSRPIFGESPTRVKNYDPCFVIFWLKNDDLYVVRVIFWFKNDDLYVVMIIFLLKHEDLCVARVIFWLKMMTYVW